MQSNLTVRSDYAKTVAGKTYLIRHEEEWLFMVKGCLDSTTQIKKKFPPIAIIIVLTQKQADNSFVVHI